MYINPEGFKYLKNNKELQKHFGLDKCETSEDVLNRVIEVQDFYKKLLDEGKITEEEYDEIMTYLEGQKFIVFTSKLKISHKIIVFGLFGSIFLLIFILTIFR